MYSFRNVSKASITKLCMYVHYYDSVMLTNTMNLALNPWSPFLKI